MKLLDKLTRILNSNILEIPRQSQPTLLGRWRFVGSQKQEYDLLELKMKNKMKRYNEKIVLN